jgi:hypothetical protein
MTYLNLLGFVFVRSNYRLRVWSALRRLKTAGADLSRYRCLGGLALVVRAIDMTLVFLSDLPLAGGLPQSLGMFPTGICL